MDTIKINVPAFLRLIELAREEVKNDADLHDMAEIVTQISKDQVVTMQHYDEIVHFVKNQGLKDDLDIIKHLGGILR